MSLSGLNSPSLVAIAGVASIAGLPHFEKLVIDGAVSWTALKALNALSYAINSVSVSVPGRIDGEETEALTIENDGTGKTVKRSEEAQLIASFLKGRSLVTPSGWAFAIWGPIYAGELVFVVSHLLVPESAPVAALIKKLSPAFIVGQSVQSLWCAAFRPKYKGKLVYISAGLLAGAAYSLSKVHNTFATSSSSSSSYSSSQYCLYFLPMTLHFGWLTAATLVNLNGAVAINKSTSLKTVAVIGHISAVAASCAGVFVTLSRSAPVFGGVISWALFAVADSMKKRISAGDKEDGGTLPGLHGAVIQRSLCSTGAILSLGTAIFVAFVRK